METTTRFSVFAPAGEEPDPKALAQMEMVMSDERAVAGALMADHHLGYSMPIGGVVAYDGAISPSGVGFDIACGNKAVKVPLTAGEITGSLAQIMLEIETRISFGMGRANDTPVDHELFETHRHTLEKLDRLADRKRQSLIQKARAQLGTVGSGNHYVDLLADEKTGEVWVANHFGSRGLGHTIATGFLNLAANKEFTAQGKEAEHATVIPTDSELGQFYLASMQLAGDYAYAGRDYVIDQVLGILGVPALVTAHSHHNFAWLEEDWWVVRKGATPLYEDQLAFIGGSMGDGAVIVRRREGDYLRGSLGSAPHGAGRLMSRTKAAGKTKRRTMYGCPDRDCDHAIKPNVFFENEANQTCPAHGKGLQRFTKIDHSTPGVVDWPKVQADLAGRGIILRGAGADEAPEVYKNLDAVLAAHTNVEVLVRLRPLGVVMAGADVFDPYVD